MRELKQGSLSKGALANEQACKKAGRQASTRKAFSWSHSLEGLVLLCSRGLKKCKVVLESLKKLYYILELCPVRSCSNSKRFNCWVLLELVIIM